jgi:hypothetical protein
VRAAGGQAVEGHVEAELQRAAPPTKKLVWSIKRGRAALAARGRRDGSGAVDFGASSCSGVEVVGGGRGVLALSLWRGKEGSGDRRWGRKGDPRGGIAVVGIG